MAWRWEAAGKSLAGATRLNSHMGLCVAEVRVPQCGCMVAATKCHWLDTHAAVLRV